MILRVYAAGGAGTNILLASKIETIDFGNMEVKTTYIDTSDSNLTAGLEPHQYYLVENGSKGSGSERRTNSKPIQDAIPDILIKHPPAEFNIVISSTSGGSGSVIAPELVSELMSRNKNVIVLSIGSVNSAIAVKNTQLTLMSYNNIAKLRSRPVVMGYYQNVPVDQPASKVDEFIISELTALATLFSLATTSSGLDETDLRNWLDYTKTCNYPPRLVAFGVLSTKCPKPPKEFHTVISVATVSNNIDAAYYPDQVDYHCTGIFNDPDQHLNALIPMHYVVADGYYDEVSKELCANLDQLRERSAARRIQPSSLDSATTGDASGTLYDF